MGTLPEPRWGRPSFDTPARGGADEDSDDVGDVGGGGDYGGDGDGGGGGGGGGVGGIGGFGGGGGDGGNGHKRPYGSTMPTQPDQTPASKGGKCELCGLWFKLSDCVIDLHGVDVPAFGYKVDGSLVTDAEGSGPSRSPKQNKTKRSTPKLNTQNLKTPKCFHPKKSYNILTLPLVTPKNTKTPKKQKKHKIS